MKKQIMLFIALGLTTAIFSQNTSDALRYSRLFYGGTARFQGLGGAFGALGADFSSLQTNPAGIGMYKSSEITFGPSLLFNNSTAEYNGISSSDNKFNGAIANVGMVFTIKNPKSKLKNINIGFGINRQNDYNTRFYVGGPNNKNSILTDFTDLVNSRIPIPTPVELSSDPFDVALAYDANLIYQDPNSGLYTSDIQNGGVYQTKSVVTYGSMNEFDLAFGGNFNDRLYFGATIGVPYLRYFEKSTYTEVNNDPSIQHFQSLKYKQELETYGTGVNLKIGLIYRPADWVRIGASIHTPTWFGNMRDNWNSQMTSSFYDSTQWNQTIDSPLGNFDYQLSTPFRAIGSLAFIIGNMGLISAEYEYVDYGSARFYDPQKTDTYTSLNQDISNAYKSPINLRAGTEWKIMDFRIRGGVGYSGSPYKTGDTGSRLAISGGLGYRGKYFFSDLSYVWAKTSDNYYLYSPIFVNAATIKTISNTLTATVGIRF